MKQLFSALLICTTLVSTAQKKWSTIKGDGNLQKETRSVSRFTAIEDKGSMNVEIAYGDQVAVTVEADQNLLPYITTNVEKGTLVIATKDYGISSAKRIKVYVTMPAINGLVVSGSGSIVAKGAFRNEGATALDIKGSGSIQFGFEELASVTAEVHGSGSIDLQGSQVAALEADVHGSGNIDAFAVSTKNANVHTHGSGNIKVNVSQRLEASSDGSGNVYYKGAAADVHLRSNGSGRVIKAR